MSIQSFLEFTPKIGQGTYIHPSAEVIGNVTIGQDSSIWPFACLRGDMHYIAIGDRTSIQDSCVLHITHPGDYNAEGYPLNIGSDVTVGHRVILHGCTVNDFCIIGMGATLLDGVIVQSDVIVGANSLVPPGKILDSGFLWVGSPVVKKRPLTEQEKAFIRYSAKNYVKLKNQYLGV